MKPPRFEYHDPETLREALSFLAETAEKTKVLAGGQSLVPMLSMRLLRPEHVLDLRRIERLRTIERRDGVVAIGAMVRQSDAMSSDLVCREAPLLRRCLPFVGHAATRNRGTIGGSLADADPAAEIPAAAVALEADVVVAGPRHERIVPARSFLTGRMTTALEPDELVTEIRIPPQRRQTGVGVREHARRHGGIALVGMLASLELDPRGRVANPVLVGMGIGSTPVRLHAAEAVLEGEVPADDLLAELRAVASGSVEPAGDIHASAGFRRRIAGVIAARAVGDAIRAAAEGERAPEASRAQRGDRPSERLRRSTGLGPGQGRRDPVFRRAVAIEVNGALQEHEVDVRRTLADFLREDLDLTGTHLGCEQGVCGACTVQVDGQAVRSCLVLAVQADGASVRTIEGMTGEDGELHPIQRALWDHKGQQCGFCTPGMVMAAEDLLRRNPGPSREEIRSEMQGNLCRCTGYQFIVDSIAAVPAAIEEGQ